MMNKVGTRLGALALALVLCSQMLLPALAAEGDTVFIASTQELVRLAEHCVSDAWSEGRTVVLTADLELNGSFTPIPVFRGTFDGNGHTISGVVLTEKGSSMGLFRYLEEGAVVKNLGLEAEVAPGGSAVGVGALAGENRGTVERVTVSGSVTGAEDVGGLVGVNGESGLLRGCTNGANVTGTSRTGGLAGQNLGRIENCTNTGAVNANDNPEAKDAGGIAGLNPGTLQGCVNRGEVGYNHVGYNVGGIAGAMSIDEEDPEDSAAGSVEYQIGRKYFTKCLITDSVNEGFVTAKKDGAGGIVGYMRHGIVTDSEGYGSVESTEGGYVGGICGESLTVIRNCYALCTVSGGRNVGGIAGFADTLKDCYAMADCQATAGRKGAIAGQTVWYDDGVDEEEIKVSGNYFVSDRLCGIDDVSYAGAAEPIDYASLLQVEGLPVQFRHLKAIFRVEGRYLGTQELKYGESLAELDYPPIPEREGYYGVWPEYPWQVMTGNLLIDGEYKEDVTVVQSNELEEQESGEGEGTVSSQVPGTEKWERPYALAEQRFTEDTKLAVSLGGIEPPAAAADRTCMIYNITLENAGVKEGDAFAVRLYNPYEDALVWGYQNGVWTELAAKERGQYLQVEMTGTEQSFCVAEKAPAVWVIAGTVIGGAAAVAALALAAGRLRRIKKKKSKRYKTHRNEKKCMS